MSLGEETPANSWRGVLGELIGVMFLVLFGCGSVTASNFFLNDGVSKLIFIAGSFGYIVCMCLFLSSVSFYFSSCVFD
jgi:glycerol uptake facilitator-like aquaporin